MSRADGGTRGAQRRGAGLAEVVVALVVIEIGLLAMAGLLRLAAAETARARRAELARWETTAVADSILAGRLGAEGERATSWGILRWAPAGSGTRLEALPAEGREPWLRIRIPRSGDSG